MADERTTTGDMAGLFENAFMLGLGVLGMTRDKVTEVTDELIERGRMSQADAAKVADRVTRAAGEQQAAMREVAAEEARRVLTAADVPTRMEMDALRTEVADLRAEIARVRGGEGAG